jgi:hypothetical protein
MGTIERNQFFWLCAAIELAFVTMRDRAVGKIRSCRSWYTLLFQVEYRLVASLS